MAYERWLMEQLDYVDPQGDRALYYSLDRGYYVAPLPKNGVADGSLGKAEMVLKLDRRARLELLLDEVASYAARGRDWLSKGECEPDRWESQCSHFQRKVARTIRRAMENHQRQRELPKEAIATVVATAAKSVVTSTNTKSAA